MTATHPAIHIVTNQLAEHGFEVQHYGHINPTRHALAYSRKGSPFVFVAEVQLNHARTRHNVYYRRALPWEVQLWDM